jgi:hypothetical protein
MPDNVGMSLYLLHIEKKNLERGKGESHYFCLSDMAEGVGGIEPIATRDLVFFAYSYSKRCNFAVNPVDWFSLFIDCKIIGTPPPPPPPPWTQIREMELV